MFENGMWLLIVAGGPLVLAIVIAWALLTRRQLGQAERRERDEKTREGYRDCAMLGVVICSPPDIANLPLPPNYSCSLVHDNNPCQEEKWGQRGV